MGLVLHLQDGAFFRLRSFRVFCGHFDLPVVWANRVSRM